MVEGVNGPKPLGELMVQGLAKANPALGGGVALIAAVVVWKFLPSHPVPMWILVCSGLLAVWVMVALLNALLQARTDHRNLAEERATAIVSAAVCPYSPYDSSVCVLIVKWPRAAALPVGASVVISTAEDDHERPLGSGCVRPPQQDGQSVVTLDRTHTGVDEFIKTLISERKSDAVRRLRVGPGFDLQAQATATGVSIQSGEQQMKGPGLMEGESQE